MPKIPTSVLNESVTIQRLSGSSVDDRGLSTATFSDNVTSVQCRITHDTGEEINADGRTEVNDVFTMTIRPDVDIKNFASLLIFLTTMAFPEKFLTCSIDKLRIL